MQTRSVLINAYLMVYLYIIDDSSIYWSDETSFSVAVSEVWNSGRTSYGIMKFYNNGTWMVIYDGMNRPVEDVPMANEVFHAIVG